MLQNCIVRGGRCTRAQSYSSARKFHTHHALILYLSQSLKVKAMSLGRSLSMLALINDGILDPGDKVLTFDYMVSCGKCTLRHRG